MDIAFGHNFMRPYAGNSKLYGNAFEIWGAGGTLRLKYFIGRNKILNNQIIECIKQYPCVPIVQMSEYFCLSLERVNK